MFTPAQAQEFELGTNLDAVIDFSPQVPFLDLFKLSRDWYTQSASVFDTEEAFRLNLDADGWVRSLAPTGNGPALFTRACTLVFSMGAVTGGTEEGRFPYPAGDYVVRYDGEGTLEYNFAASRISGSTGRDVIRVTPLEPGIQICITQSDPGNNGNYLRNIRLYAPGHEALAEDAIFDPEFLARLAPFGALRFMDWMRTNDSTQAEVETRPLPEHARYSTEAGVPAEIMAALANTLEAKPWFNMPHRATDAYVTEFATVIRNTLDSDLDVYVEYSNEIWNNQFLQGSFIEEEGIEKFAAMPGSNFDRRLNRFGERTAEICDIWREVFGNDAGRVNCVMGGQAANTFIAQEALECPMSSLAPCRDHGITALAIAPYIGDSIGLPDFESTVEDWTEDDDGGLGQLFTELNTESVLGDAEGGLPTVRDRIAFHAELALDQGVELLAYEGGQHLVGVGAPAENFQLNTLFDAANRDARMGALYKSYLNTWIAEGGGLFMHFSDTGSYSRFGRWGALELPDQSGSPKYNALVQISRTECIFNFAEVAFKKHFSPAGELNRMDDNLVFRQYGNGTLVGTAEDGSIFALRPNKGNQLVKIATIKSLLGISGCR
jgi:hypothetical protein